MPARNKEKNRQQNPLSVAKFLSSLVLLVLAIATNNAAATNQHLALAADSTRFYNSNMLYRDIAMAALATRPVAGEFQVEAKQLEATAFRRTRLPRVYPVARVNSEGGTVAQLVVEQVVFSSGRFAAGSGLLRAEQDVEYAQFLLDTNALVAEAIKVYLSLHRAGQLAQSAQTLASHYEGLWLQARQRLDGGVGTLAEAALFELKTSEAISELERDEAEVARLSARLQALTNGSSLRTKPQRFVLSTARRPEPTVGRSPALLLAAAQLERARQALRVSRAERLPEVKLVGRLGKQTNTNDLADDFSIQLGVGKPIAWGRDYGLKQKQAEVQAAEASLQYERQNLTRQAQLLEHRTQQLVQQLPRYSELAAMAEQRISFFQSHFLGGAVPLTQAVSVLDAYETARRTEVETTYQILLAELQQAEISGLLGPIKP